jgi:IPT/TIG domain
MKAHRSLVSLLILIIMIFIGGCSKDNNEPTPSSSDLVVNSFSPLSGGEGTNVIVLGANFDEKSDNNTVTFNGTPGTVAVASKTQLTVLVPKGASTGRIQVTTNGKTATSGADFTIITDPD